MAIYSGTLSKAQNILGSSVTTSDWIDSKIKFVKTIDVNQITFTEQETVQNNASELNNTQTITWRGFDITDSTDESYTTTITRSPIEDGTSVVEGISKPIEVFKITGTVGQIVVDFPQKLATLEGNLISILSTAGRFAPTLIGPAQQTILKGLDKINKIKSQVDGILGDARGFYDLVRNFHKADFQRRYVAFKTVLINSQQNKTLFKLRIHGIEHSDLAITSITFTQEPQVSVDAIKISITFEKINRIEIAKNINQELVIKTSREVAIKEEKEKTRSSVGKKRPSLAVQIGSGILQFLGFK